MTITKQKILIKGPTSEFKILIIIYNFIFPKDDNVEKDKCEYWMGSQNIKFS